MKFSVKKNKMKRSFLDAFKTSLDLENQTQDIAVKMRQAPNENRVREVLHIKNSGYRGLKSEYNEGQDNSVYFLERGTSYLYQEEILRKATQIEEQETEDECEPDRKMDIDEIFYDKIFVDISNVTGTN
jgi:hypothetical protein